MWYIYLDKLCEKGMLKTSLVTEEGVKQKVTSYEINEESSFELPEFSLLPDRIITKVTLDTIDTKVTLVTKDSDIDKNNCKDCNKCIITSYKKEQGEAK